MRVLHSADSALALQMPVDQRTRLGNADDVARKVVAES
jgi:hypothetical protein